MGRRELAVHGARGCNGLGADRSQKFNIRAHSQSSCALILRFVAVGEAFPNLSMRRHLPYDKLDVGKFEGTPLFDQAESQ
jgi:hypothetical protein